MSEMDDVDFTNTPVTSTNLGKSFEPEADFDLPLIPSSTSEILKCIDCLGDLVSNYLDAPPLTFRKHYLRMLISYIIEVGLHPKSSLRKNFRFLVGNDAESVDAFIRAWEENIATATSLNTGGSMNPLQIEPQTTGPTLASLSRQCSSVLNDATYRYTLVDRFEKSLQELGDLLVGIIVLVVYFMCLGLGMWLFTGTLFSGGLLVGVASLLVSMVIMFIVRTQKKKAMLLSRQRDVLQTLCMDRAQNDEFASPRFLTDLPIRSTSHQQQFPPKNDSSNDLRMDQGSNSNVITNNNNNIRFLMENKIFEKHLMIIIVKRDGTRKISFWNKLCERVTGFSDKEVEGNDFFSILVDDRSKTRLVSMLEGTLHSTTIEVVTSKAALVPIELSTYSQHSDDNTCCLVGAMSNATTGNSFVAEALQYVTCHVQDALAVLDELKVPPNEEFRIHEIERVLESIQYERIYSALQHWSTNFSVIDVRDVIGCVVEQTLPMVRSNHVFIDVNIHPKVPETVLWDPTSLAHILEYLVSYCVRRGLRYGTLQLTVEVKKMRTFDALVISVCEVEVRTDSGVLSSLMSTGALTMWQNTVELAGGSGRFASSPTTPALKLAMLKSTLELCGGKISCSVEPHGTTWSVQIPMLPLHEPAYNLVESEISIPNLNCDGRFEVVVYENNSMFLSTITHILWGNGHSVVRCSTVDEVYQAIENNRINVLVFDIDDTDAWSRFSDLQQRCDEQDIVLAGTTTVKKRVTTSSKEIVMKPVEPGVLQALLDKANDIERRAKAKEDQIKHLKEMFTEYVACEQEMGPCIGTGAFGKVYTVRSVLTGGLTAVKMIPLDTGDPEIESRTHDLLNEIGILRAMSHPNVIHYFRCERSLKTVNIYMEFANGGSVWQMLEKKTVSSSKCARVIREVLQALHYIHGLNIIHRDIKAANILISNNTIKLADFGSATKLQASGTTRGNKGSLRWMSPEVMRDEAPYGVAADIWSIGCFAVELLTRTPPFSSISSTSTLPVLHYVMHLPPTDLIRIHITNGFFDARFGIDPHLPDLLSRREGYKTLESAVDKLISELPFTRAGIDQATKLLRNGGFSTDHISLIREVVISILEKSSSGMQELKSAMEGWRRLFVLIEKSLSISDGSSSDHQKASESDDLTSVEIEGVVKTWNTVSWTPNALHDAFSQRFASTPTLDPTARSFLDMCLQVDPTLRSNTGTLLSHPFLSQHRSVFRSKHNTNNSNSNSVNANIASSSLTLDGGRKSSLTTSDSTSEPELGDPLSVRRPPRLPFHAVLQ